MLDEIALVGLGSAGRADNRVPAWRNGHRAKRLREDGLMFMACTAGGGFRANCTLVAHLGLIRYVQPVYIASFNGELLLVSDEARYIVEIRHRSGHYLAEVDLDRTARDTVLTDLLAGQYAGAARVYRLADATAEFARAVSQRCVDEGEDVPLWLADLLDNASEPASARFNVKPAEAAAT